MKSRELPLTFDPVEVVLITDVEWRPYVNPQTYSGEGRVAPVDSRE